MDDASLMDLALEEARRAAAADETAVAALIARGGVVLACVGSRVRATGNPLNHAETAAIALACEALGRPDLGDCTIYATTEPCPMCAWAICLAGIPRLVVGARFASFHRPDLGGYAIEALLAMTGRRLEVVASERQPEATAFRRDWGLRTGRLL